jgi:hypothetical protein
MADTPASCSQEQLPALEPEAPLTARTARILHVLLRRGATQVYDDLHVLGDDAVGSVEAGELAVLPELPTLTYAKDALWRRQMARAFDDLADDLAAGRTPYPRCTGEAVALWLALEWAPDYVRYVATGTLAPDQAGEGDDNWEELREVMFRDTDFLELYNPAMDGFEHTEEAIFLGVENMNPKDWFSTLSLTEPRDPRRPFRR